MAKTATKKKTQASTAPPGVLNGIPLSLLLLAAFVLGFAICYGMFAMQAGAGSATTTTDLDSTPAGR